MLVPSTGVASGQAALGASSDSGSCYGCDKYPAPKYNREGWLPQIEDLEVGRGFRGLIERFGIEDLAVSPLDSLPRWSGC
jgi:hypothetical protein